MQDYWVKQQDKPAFPDLLWSRPVNKSSAGKLVIIGGNLHGFNIVANAFNSAQKAGAGTIRLVLPDALQKLLGKIIPEAEFAPSTTSGSFAKLALNEISNAVNWADGVLLVGEFGKNSETAILLENIVKNISIPLVIAGDTIDELLNNPGLLSKSNIIIGAEFSQLQKLAINTKYSQAFTSTMTILKFVETLHDFAKTKNINVVTYFEGQTFVSTEGRVSSTRTGYSLDKIAAKVSVWYMQNPDKKFEAATTSLVNNNS